MGLQALDGLKPSDYLRETAIQNIEGRITIEQAEDLIHSYYEAKDIRTLEEQREEADKVSVNIAKGLSERAFSFSAQGLILTHKRIFEGVFDFAGVLRSINIVKKEWILNGDKVLYAPASDLIKTIEYDLDRERIFDYTPLNEDEVVSHITEFVAGLWQIHPFMEGNTRTTAVFIIQYLRSLGWKVDNDLFEKHSWYFRNALVRANYRNVKRGLARNTTYLEKFFQNLLLNTTHELSNQELRLKSFQIKKTNK